jgi:protein-S-isoprenylcysteine O-methyltransferase Ste14
MALSLRALVMIGGLAIVLFGAAGRWDLPFFWAYLAIWGLLLLALPLVVDGGLARERLSVRGAGRGRYLRLLLLPFGLTHWIVAGLDVSRYRWSDPMPAGMQVGGLVGVAAAWALVLWAMRVNRFFSPAVRVQAQGEHRVVTVGLYRYVRHPGYAAMILGFSSSGFALGSWWSLPTVLPYVVLILVRTLREDRFLRHELLGYTEYALTVRYRLARWVW